MHFPSFYIIFFVKLHMQQVIVYNWQRRFMRVIITSLTKKVEEKSEGGKNYLIICFLMNSHTQGHIFGCLHIISLVIIVWWCYRAVQKFLSILKIYHVIHAMIYVISDLIIIFIFRKRKLIFIKRASHPWVIFCFLRHIHEIVKNVQRKLFEINLIDLIMWFWFFPSLHFDLMPTKKQSDMWENLQSRWSSSRSFSFTKYWFFCVLWKKISNDDDLRK